ncbi:MAG: SPFH domain-containing protein [Candidatus Peribacteraceae bacterium]|nr:SPFH domain-containing protein [Candidatus Peribacteraceae bacterium]
MKNIIKLAVASLVALTLIITAFNSYTVVSPGEAKVGTIFGNVSDSVLTEGFHVVNPLMSFDIYSVRDFTMTLTDVQIPSEDKLKTTMDFTVTMRTKPSSLIKMKREAGNLQDAFDKYALPQINSLLKECGKGVENSQDFFKDEVQSTMQSFMLSNLNERLNASGFQVSVAVFSELELPPLVKSAIETTKRLQEEENQQKATLKIKDLQAQEKTMAAKARNLSATEDAAARIKLADAAAYEILAENTALAQANVLLNKSITPALIDYALATRWNGVRSTTVVGSATPLMNIK